MNNSLLIFLQKEQARLKNLLTITESPKAKKRVRLELSKVEKLLAFPQ